jgi:hypothetical protein
MVTLLSYDLAVVADGAGRLRLFALGRDGVLYHLTQTQPNDGWSGWTNLGTPGAALADSSAPAAGRVNLIDLVGLGVFVVGEDGTAYRRIQQLPDGSWSPWESLAGSQLPIASSVVPVLGAGGVNYLFAIGGDDLVENSDLTTTTAGPAWSVHAGLPLPYLEPSPAVGSSADGRLEVLAVADGGELLHQWQLTVAGKTWSAWFSHGVTPGGSLYSSPAVAAAADGRLEVFAVDVGLMLWHKWQTAPNDGWSDWYSHGNPQGDTSGAEGVFPTPAVAAAADGRLELFAVGGSQADPTKERALYHKWQTAPNDGWSDWYSHGTPGVSLAGNPAAAAAADGRLELFVVGADGVLYHKWQTAPNDGWSDWFSHGHP